MTTQAFVRPATAVMSVYEAIASCSGLKPRELRFAAPVLPIAEVGNALLSQLCGTVLLPTNHELVAT